MRSANDSSLQTDIQRWWDTHPMTYDWHNTLTAEEGTPAFYQEIDRRFWAAAWFAHQSGEQPFSRLIGYSSLQGRRVLEIGCGAGAITAQLAKSGAEISAIDLTSQAIALTRRRF